MLCAQVAEHADEAGGGVCRHSTGGGHLPAGMLCWWAELHQEAQLMAADVFLLVSSL